MNMVSFTRTRVAALRARTTAAVVMVAAVAATCCISGGARAADLQPAFSTEVCPGGISNNAAYEIRMFTALLKDNKRIVGKPVGDKAVARGCNDRWRNAGNTAAAGWCNAQRLLPTGVDGMAVGYPVDGDFGLADFSAALELRGRGWKADSGFRETLLRMGGEDAAATLFSDGRGNLVLRSSAGGQKSDVTVKAPAALDKIHTLIVTASQGKAAIYWDGLLLGSGPSVGAAKVKTVALGQLGPGPGDNKDIIRAEIFDQALIQAQVSQWHLDVGIQPAAHITLVKRKKPIVIDGVIEPDEWADAARITGLSKVSWDEQYAIHGPATLASDQSEFYLAYDDDNLYFAHHSPPPARIADQTQLVVAMLKRTKTKHDDAVVMDDNIKLTFLNSYPDVGEEKRIYINGCGTTYEFLPLAWDPPIERQSRLTDTGWWIEASVPWKDLNMGPPADGKTIHMNLMRGWKQELDENHIWTFGQYDAATGRLVAERESPNPAGAITLAGSEGVVVRLDGVGKLNRGQVNIAATLVNLTSKAVKLNATLDSNSGAVKDAREVSLAAGADKASASRARLPISPPRS